MDIAWAQVWDVLQNIMTLGFFYFAWKAYSKDKPKTSVKIENPTFEVVDDYDVKTNIMANITITNKGDRATSLIKVWLEMSKDGQNNTYDMKFSSRRVDGHDKKTILCSHTFLGTSEKWSGTYEEAKVCVETTHKTVKKKKRFLNKAKPAD